MESRIPNRLKKYRRWNRLLQKQVAKKLGLSDTSILSRWEKGMVYPSIGNLFRLCRIYQTIPQELYSELWKNVTNEFSFNLSADAHEESLTNKRITSMRTST